MPSARTASIWSIRITALRAIIPSSARIPRIATKPSGWRNSSSAATTPIRPIGTTLRTRNSTAEALQLHHQQGDRDEQHQRHHRVDRGLRLRALLDRAAHGDVIGLRQARLELRNRGGERADHGFGRSALRDVGLDGQGRNAVAAPDQRKLLLEIQGRELRRAGPCGRSAAGTAGCAASTAKRAARRSPASPRRRGRFRRAPG